MSRSYRKAIVKCRALTDSYWRSIRSSQNQTVREIPKLVDPETYDITSEKTIINDYTYRDYIFRIEYSYSNKDGLKPENIEHQKKWRRK